MFKNAMVGQLTGDLDLSNPELIADFSEKLKKCEFKDIAPGQRSSAGFVAPLAFLGGSDLVLVAERCIKFVIKKEERILPAAAVNKALKDKVLEIERSQGRKVRAVEKRQLKDNLVSVMLPNCLKKESFIEAFISIDARLVVVDTVSGSVFDEVMALLRKCFSSWPVMPVQFDSVLSSRLLSVLTDENNTGFKLGFKAKFSDGDGGSLSINDMDLETEEVLAQVASMSAVELEFSSNEISFSLTDQFLFKSFKWPEAFKMKNDAEEDELARADADFCLMTGELLKIITGFMAWWGEAKAVQGE